MKNFIILILLLAFTNICYADELLTITIRNKSDAMVIIYIDSIDHGVKINGKVYTSPLPACVAELQPQKGFVLAPRGCSKFPYRYVLTVCRTVDRQIVSKESTMFKVRPDQIRTEIFIYDSWFEILSSPKIGEEDG